MLGPLVFKEVLLPDCKQHRLPALDLMRVQELAVCDDLVGNLGVPGGVEDEPGWCLLDLRGDSAVQQSQQSEV